MIHRSSLRISPNASCEKYAWPPTIESIALGMATHPVLWCAAPRSIYTRRHQTDMAKDTQMPELTRDDVAALIDILRKAGRPMTTDELVAALREAAAQG